MAPKSKFSSPEQKKLANALRNAFEAGRIGPNMEVLLDTVRGPVWKDRRVYRAVEFEDAFSALERYVTEFGHAAVPFAYVTADGISLGKWVSGLRQGVNGTKNVKVSDTDRARLDALPGWLWSTRKSFDEVHSMLREYADEFGHTNVPQRHRGTDGYSLGVWVAKARAAHNGVRKSELSEEQMEILAALPGWVWSTRRSFDDVVVLLRSFAEEFGHTNVPRRYVAADGFTLGTWVANVRAAVNGTRGPGLPEVERSALEALPGWRWSAPRGPRAGDAI